MFHYKISLSNGGICMKRLLPILTLTSIVFAEPYGMGVAPPLYSPPAPPSPCSKDAISKRLDKLDFNIYSDKLGTQFTISSKPNLVRKVVIHHWAQCVKAHPNFSITIEVAGQAGQNAKGSDNSGGIGGGGGAPVVETTLGQLARASNTMHSNTVVFTEIVNYGGGAAGKSSVGKTGAGGGASALLLNNFVIAVGGGGGGGGIGEKIDGWGGEGGNGGGCTNSLFTTGIPRLFIPLGPHPTLDGKNSSYGSVGGKSYPGVIDGGGGRGVNGGGGGAGWGAGNGGGGGAGVGGNSRSSYLSGVGGGNGEDDGPKHTDGGGGGGYVNPILIHYGAKCYDSGNPTRKGYISITD